MRVHDDSHIAVGGEVKVWMVALPLCYVRRSACAHAPCARWRVQSFAGLRGLWLGSCLQERFAGCQGNDVCGKQQRKRCILVEKVHARDERFHHKRPLDLEDRPIFSCQEDRPLSVSDFDSFNPACPAISTRCKSLHHKTTVTMATCVFNDGPRWAQAGHLHRVRQVSAPADIL
jgi:hypothetical protein